MSGYTEAVWDFDTDGLRHIHFPAGALHLAEPQEFRDYLGFTVCGRVIPQMALIDEEIPERFRPHPCHRCEAWLENRALDHENWVQRMDRHG